MEFLFNNQYFHRQGLTNLAITGKLNGAFVVVSSCLKDFATREEAFITSDGTTMQGPF